MKIFKASFVALVAAVQLVQAGKYSDDNFECSSIGSFADDDDSSCKRYYTCKVGGGGRWIKSSYDCPLGTLFDKNSKHCSSVYKCQPDSDESSGEYDDGDFVCKKPGLYDDVSDPSCSKYYECRQNHHGALFPIQFTCPPPSRFHPKEKHCTKHYVCPRHFKCTAKGRFDDTSDENNKRYYLCLKRDNGDFVDALYSCPLYSRFDPIDKICVVPDDSVSDEEEVHDPSLPTENWDNLDSFTCSARGFFAKTNDKTCKVFYLCDVNADGKLDKYVLACQKGYGWDRNTNLCRSGLTC